MWWLCWSVNICNTSIIDLHALNFCKQYTLYKHDVIFLMEMDWICICMILANDMHVEQNLNGSDSQPFWQPGVWGWHFQNLKSWYEYVLLKQLVEAHYRLINLLALCKIFHDGFILTRWMLHSWLYHSPLVLTDLIFYEIVNIECGICVNKLNILAWLLSLISQVKQYNRWDCIIPWNKTLWLQIMGLGLKHRIRTWSTKQLWVKEPWVKI